MSPSAANPPRGKLLLAMVLAHMLWRIICFAWGPLNLQTWPGAAFEASAIAASGLLVVWLILGEGSLPRRLIGVGFAYLGLRIALVAGVFLHFHREASLDLELQVFRRVEDYVIVCCLVITVAIRGLSGWQVQQRAADKTTTIQFRLQHLFLLTAVVAVLLGMAKAKWFPEILGQDQVLFFHAVTIALAIFPALAILLTRPRWNLLLMIAIWAALPPCIAWYFHYAEWLTFNVVLLRHLLTTVLGPAVVTTATALTLRVAGYRWQRLPNPAKCSLPKEITLPT